MAGISNHPILIDYRNQQQLNSCSMHCDLNEPNRPYRLADDVDAADLLHYLLRLPTVEYALRHGLARIITFASNRLR